MTSVATREDIAKAAIETARGQVEIEPLVPLPTMNQGQVMDHFRYLLDLKELLEQWAKEVGSELTNVKENMIERSISEGVSKFTSDRLTVSVVDVDKVRITGDWEQIQKDLIVAGYGTAVQRRVSDKHILDAYYSGDFHLPDGIEIVTFKQTTQRRK